jgi:hypothetical protein
MLPAHTVKPIQFDNILISNTIERAKAIPIIQLSEEDFIETLISRITSTPPNHLS